MAIKLVVSDIDGTLIDGTEAIAPELIEAAQKCKEHGVVFSFATGRTKELAARLVKTVGITSPYVISNGACIFQEEKCLVSHNFSVEPILSIIRQPQCAFRPLVGEGDSQTFGVCSANDG